MRVSVLGWVLELGLGLVLLRVLGGMLHVLGGMLHVLGRMLERMQVRIQQAEYALLGAARLALCRCCSRCTGSGGRRRHAHRRLGGAEGVVWHGHLGLGLVLAVQCCVQCAVMAEMPVRRDDGRRRCTVARALALALALVWMGVLAIGRGVMVLVWVLRDSGVERATRWMP